MLFSMISVGFGDMRGCAVGILRGFDGRVWLRSGNFHVIEEASFADGVIGVLEGTGGVGSATAIEGVAIRVISSGVEVGSSRASD